MYDDDIAHRAAFFLIDATNPAEVLAFYRANIGAGVTPDGAFGTLLRRPRTRLRSIRQSAIWSGRRCGRAAVITVWSQLWVAG